MAGRGCGAECEAMAGRGTGGDLVGPARPPYRGAHGRDRRRPALCRLRPRMGRRFAAPDVRVSAKSGVRIDPAGVCDFRRGAVSACRAALAGLSRRADPVGRHRRRGARRRAAQEIPHQSRQPGPGMRCRAVALVAASELFLRMVRLACLSGDRDLDRRILFIILGAGRACWRRSSCTGSWCTSPASRRSSSRCCARAASATATISRAPACSFRCHRKREWSHERRLQRSSAPPNGCRCPTS